MSRHVLFAATAVMALAASAHAQVPTVDLAPLAAAPAEQQAASALKGGAICIRQGPLTGAEMRRAFTTGQADARLREALSKAGVMVNGAGLAAVGVAGVARISELDACLPNYGFASMDAVSGKVEVAVDWTLTDRATGAEIGRLSTRERVERKGGSGGLAGLVDEAIAANASSLAANPALRTAAARPLLASARVEAAAPRDPTLLVLPPWRPSTQKAPLAIAAPLIIESDLDMVDNLDQSEHFAVPLEAGETLRLEVLETGSKIAMVVANPGGRYIAGTHPRNPERQLSATAKTAGTYVVSAWTSGDPPVTPYRLKIDTDRRPYGEGATPRPPSIAQAPAPAKGPAGPVALRWVTAAPLAAQAAGQIGAGSLCTAKEPAFPSEMRKAIESGVLDARLRDDLKAAGFQVVGGLARTEHGVAPVSLAAEVTITGLEGCLANWGLADFDTASGKVAMVVDWVVRDRASGAELARLTTQQGVERKKDSGGLLVLTQDGFSTNIKTLLADPAMRAAMRRPALSAPRADDGPAPDPLRLVIPPWRPTAFGARNILPVPRVVESDIDSTDEDKTSARETYKISVSAGEALSITVTDAQRPLRVGVTDMQGALLADTFGASPSLAWKAPAAGDYLILVTSTDRPRQTPYRMSIESDLRPRTPQKPAVAETPKPPIAPPVAKPAPPQPPAPLPPMPKLVPPPGVLAAEIGKPVNRPAGKAGAAVDLFAFIGEAGSVAQVTAGAAGAGGLSLTLHTPEGDRMMQADGVDKVGLSAILPKDGVYLLSVGRQDAARPYRLNLAAETPDIFQWSFRENAGYEILGPDGKAAYWTCWAAPGSALTYVRPGGREATLRVSAGGDGAWDLADAPDYSFTTKLTGGVFIRTSSTGKLETWSIRDEKTTGAYRGYFCP